MSEIELQILLSFCESVPLGVCLVDLQGKIMYWNPAAESISGYMGHEVLGRTYRGDLLIQAANSKASQQSPLAEVLREGRPVESDLFLRHKLGNRIPVRIYAFPLRDATGEVVGAAEVLERTQHGQDSPAWAGHSDREFELATGLSAIEESRSKLAGLLRSRSAITSAVILIELPELHALLQHGGSAMLHQGIRVVAKTVSQLLPARNHVGCWSDWRLVAFVPDCTSEALEQIRSDLAGVGSSCSVKWWGDRVAMSIRFAATYGDPSKDVDAFIRDLEQDLKVTARKSESCSSL